MASEQRNGGERAGTNRASTSRRTFLAGTTGALSVGALSVGALGRTAADDEGVDIGNVEEVDDRKQERDEPLLVAPRAFAGLYPENTVNGAEYASTAASRAGSASAGWSG
jgi:glycerophosphoryl diester phosphodiesterase